MKLQLVRHATLRLIYQNTRILIDPMFSSAGALDPVANGPNQFRNPLVDLPMDQGDLVETDAILITHTHRDHLDQTAIELLPKHLPIFCQPADETKLREYGFTAVQSITDSHHWNGIRFTRTGGQHGTGEIGQLMGHVSGFVLSSEQEPTLYIAGDTIWCPEVSNALEQHKPEITVLFAGAAQFLSGGPITMTADDIGKVAQYAPCCKAVVAHMETWNHCLLSRSELRAYLREKQLERQVLVPEDGEWIQLD